MDNWRIEVDQPVLPLGRAVTPARAGAQTTLPWDVA